MKLADFITVDASCSTDSYFVALDGTPAPPLEAHVTTINNILEERVNVLIQEIKEKAKKSAGTDEGAIFDLPTMQGIADLFINQEVATVSELLLLSASLSATLLQVAGLITDSVHAFYTQLQLEDFTKSHSAVSR